MSIMTINKPYLLFLGDAPDQLAAKTAAGIAHWRPADCIGQLRLPSCKADLGLNDLSIAQARQQGAKTLVIGVANQGGFISAQWIATLLEALEAGLDIASGLHARLDAIAELSAAAARSGRRLIEVRHPSADLKTGNGKKRTGKRLLTVGTDCSIGKMYTALAIEAELRKRGVKADFRATGQTGIFIAGNGISVDAVIADFISGAVEALCPDNDPDHWDIVEGQGSLFHAAYAGVSLGLLHGAQADALVLCHEPTRTHMRGLPHYPLPGLEDCIEANEAAARLTNPAAHCIGVSINTANLDADAAAALLADTQSRLGLPCVDALRSGVSPLVDQLV